MAQGVAGNTGQELSSSNNFTIQSLVTAQTITDHRMTGGPIPDGCAPPAAKSSFAPTDARAYQWTAVSGATVGDAVRWEFIQPDGTLYAPAQTTLTWSGIGCFWAWINIAGQPAASLPGNWQVRVFYNGTQVLTDNFSIGGGSTGGTLCANVLAGGAPPGALQRFYVGVLRLGFAAVRASCNVGRMLPAPVAALMVRDLNEAATGASAVGACIPFNTGRFTDLAGRLSGMTGDQALQEIQQLIQDLQQAVRQSNLSCTGGISTPAVESFYVATLSLGYAVTRATCFPCQDPLPAAAVAEINNDLVTAQQGLRAYAACIPAFDSSIFNSIRLGTPFTMLETYTDLTGLYSTVQWAIANSASCCTCPGS